MARTISIVWDYDTGAITTPASLWVKREETVLFSLTTRTGGDASDLPDGYTLTLTLKPSVVDTNDPTEGEFDGDPLIVVTAWTNASTGVYTASALVSSTEIDTFVGKGGDSTDDKTQPLTVADIYFTVDDARTFSDTFPLRLKNNVGRSDDGTPTAVADPGAWLQTNGLRNPGYWTAYTGGTSTSLDGVETADDATATGHVIITAILGDLATWQLQAGTAAENPTGGIVRPDDYHATTNARVWVRIA